MAGWSEALWWLRGFLALVLLNVFLADFSRCVFWLLVFLLALSLLSLFLLSLFLLSLFLLSVFWFPVGLLPIDSAQNTKGASLEGCALVPFGNFTLYIYFINLGGVKWTFCRLYICFAGKGMRGIGWVWGIDKNLSFSGLGTRGGWPAFGFGFVSKARVLLRACDGTAEAVPFPKPFDSARFAARLEAAPFQNRKSVSISAAGGSCDLRGAVLPESAATSYPAPSVPPPTQLARNSVGKHGLTPGISCINIVGQLRLGQVGRVI